jgi:hypothetical protein
MPLSPPYDCDFPLEFARPPVACLTMIGPRIHFIRGAGHRLCLCGKGSLDIETPSYGSGRGQREGICRRDRPLKILIAYLALRLRCPSVFGVPGSIARDQQHRLSRLRIAQHRSSLERHLPAGANGLRAIKVWGGFAMAQDRTTLASLTCQPLRRASGRLRS